MEEPNKSPLEKKDRLPLHSCEDLGARFEEGASTHGFVFYSTGGEKLRSVLCDLRRSLKGGDKDWGWNKKILRGHWKGKGIAYSRCT